MIQLHNIDCLPFMRQCKDNQYDLAIVDPPYGIGVAKQNNTKRGKLGSHYKQKDWDNQRPPKEYFDGLQRISKNQIIWGGNYFANLLNASSCWLVWNKKTVGNTADCELAWTNFKTAVRRFDFMWEGFWQENMKNKETRIHPTQKPVALYKWLLENYAKQGDKILDTHLGSGSIAIACEDMGFDLTACEIDKDYYDGAVKRLETYRKQQRLFK